MESGEGPGRDSGAVSGAAWGRLCLAPQFKRNRMGLRAVGGMLDYLKMFPEGAELLADGRRVGAQRTWPPLLLFTGCDTFWQYGSWETDHH